MHDSAAVGIEKLRELEVQEIRALRQAVELELAYRKQMDAQQTSRATLYAGGEMNAERINLFKAGTIQGTLRLRS